MGVEETPYPATIVVQLHRRGRQSHKMGLKIWQCGNSGGVSRIYHVACMVVVTTKCMFSDQTDYGQTDYGNIGDFEIDKNMQV